MLTRAWGEQDQSPFGTLMKEKKVLDAVSGNLREESQLWKRIHSDTQVVTLDVVLRKDLSERGFLSRNIGKARERAQLSVKSLTLGHRGQML